MAKMRVTASWIGSLEDAIRTGLEKAQAGNMVPDDVSPGGKARHALYSRLTTQLNEVLDTIEELWQSDSLSDVPPQAY